VVEIPIYLKNALFVIVFNRAGLADSLLSPLILKVKSDYSWPSFSD